MFQRSVNIEHFDGDTLHVIHHEGVEINAFHYLNGVITNLQVDTAEYFDGLERTAISSLSDGFYIIYSNLSTKIYMKGNLPRNIFIKNLSDTNPSEIEVTRYSVDGVFLGTLDAQNVHSNMYSVVVPTENIEILNIGELYVVCDISAECAVYNIAQDFPRTTLTENVLKTDIISNDLSARVNKRQHTFSLRKTTFRSD